MLAVCIPGCLLVRSENSGRVRRWFRSLAGLAGMFAGMALGGMWLTHPLTPALGSMFAAHHLAMVAGMTLGAAIGQRGARIFEVAGGREAAVALVDFGRRMLGRSSR